MNRWWTWPLQAFWYGLFCLLVAWLATSEYRYLQPNQAEVKVVFKHASQRLEECTKNTAEELQHLAPNMRRPQHCPRERAPLYIELRIDDRLVMQQTFASPGLHKDGAAYVQAKYPVVAGKHALSIVMRDSKRSEGFDFQTSQSVDFFPGRALLIGFDGNENRFFFDRK